MKKVIYYILHEKKDHNFYNFQQLTTGWAIWKINVQNTNIEKYLYFVKTTKQHEFVYYNATTANGMCQKIINYILYRFFLQYTCKRVYGHAANNIHSKTYYDCVFSLYFNCFIRIYVCKRK